MPEAENTADSLSTIDRAVERLVSALEDIATKHGSEAVDLAMTAYQVDAIRYCGLSLVGMLMALPAMWLVRGFIREVRKSVRDADEGTAVVCMIGAVVLGGVAVIGTIHALSPVMWLAAFGNPEILIATNVLKSAGLL